MSIKEKLDKIKGYGSAVLLDNAFFFGILLVLVSAGSFGLGRLSADPRVPLPLPEHSVSQVMVLPPAAHPTSSAQDAVIESSSAPSTPNESTRFLKESDAPVSGPYVGSKNSDKYHLPWCSGAKRISEANKVWFATKEEAEAAGYVPAGNCPGI